ncbi:MAG: hypothetical protein ABR596_10170, partial [Halarsenatibacteraceae bacterium]
MSNSNIIKKKEDHYRILKIPIFRKTEGVIFDKIPMEDIQPISAIDRVLHENNAFSPGPIEDVKRPW